MADGLIAFTFNNKPQDVERFRNAPLLAGAFGRLAPEMQRFGWTKFYEAVADKLLNTQTDLRSEGSIRSLFAGRGAGASPSGDKYADGTSGLRAGPLPFHRRWVYSTEA